MVKSPGESWPLGSTLTAPSVPLVPPNKPLPATLVTVAALILAFSKKKFPFSMVVRRPAVFAELSVLRNTEPVPCLRREVSFGRLIILPEGKPFETIILATAEAPVPLPPLKVTSGGLL